MTGFFNCYMCDDFLFWFMNQWFCPSCEKELIETLKYRLHRYQVAFEPEEETEENKND